MPTLTVSGRTALLKAVAKAQSEKDFQREVVTWLKQHGWVVFSTWNSRRSPAGEPDIRACRTRDKRAVWIELKSETGRLLQEQKTAIWALREAGQEVYVFKPSQWEELERALW